MGYQEQNDKIILIIFILLILGGFFLCITDKKSSNVSDVIKEKTTSVNVVKNKQEYPKKIDVDSIPVADDYAITDYARRQLSERVIPESQRRILEIQRDEARYKQYLIDSIVEEFGDSYKTSHIKAELLFRINKNGYIESYSVYGISDPDTRKYHDSDNAKIKAEFHQRLEQALLNVSPFQPFPKSMDKDSIIVGLYLGCGKTNQIIYVDQNPEPKWSHFINQQGKTRNPKRYEDTKLTFFQIFLIGWSEDGKNIEHIGLYPDKINLDWQPVKTINNHVIVRGTIEDGKIIEHSFIKKSESKEANEAAIDALYRASAPSLDRFKKKCDKVTLELHFEVY